MAQGVLLPNGKQQFVYDQGPLAGQPLANGQVYMYVPNTTTFATTWIDQAETTPNTNPIVLDAYGQCVIWGSGTYRQRVFDQSGNLQWDQLTSDAGLSSVQTQITAINTQITTINTEITTIQNQISGQLVWLNKTKVPNTGSYTCGPTDSGTLFNSASAGGSLLVELPNTSTINTGWYAGIIRSNSNPISFQVNGAHSEHILVPGGPAATNVTTWGANFEFLIVSFDGGDFEIISASPATGAFLSNSFQLFGQVFVSSGTFTIPVPNIKVTLVAGGGGGGGGGYASTSGSGGGGQAGGIVVAWYAGLTVGNTLTVTVGGGGAAGTGAASGSATAGSAGGASSLASGTQSITTAAANGGNGGGAGSSGGAGAGGTGAGGTSGPGYGVTGQTGQAGGVTSTSNVFVPGGMGGLQATPLGPFGTAGNGGGVAGNSSGGNGTAGLGGMVFIEYLQ